MEVEDIGLKKKPCPKISYEQHEVEIGDTQDFTKILFDDIVTKLDQLKKEINIKELGMDKVVFNVDFYNADLVTFSMGDYKNLTNYSMFYHPDSQPLVNAMMSFKASCQCQDSDCIKVSWFTERASLEVALNKENDDNLVITVRAFRRVCNECMVPCIIMILPEDKDRIVQLIAWRVIRLLYNNKSHILKQLQVEDES